MINPVVADLLHFCALHSRKFLLVPSVFYHLGQEKCMSDDASRIFYLSDTKFLTHMHAIHPHSHRLCQILLLPRIF